MKRNQGSSFFGQIYLDQSLSYMLDFKHGGSEKMLGNTTNWGWWSEKDEVRLLDTILGDDVFENILSVKVLELLLTC